MIDKYVLMYKDTEVGDLIYDISSKRFVFKIYKNIDHRKYLPLGMYSYENWNIDYVPTNEDIVFWLEDRVVPKERQNIDDILASLGLLYYDFWEVCRKTRAMCMEDYFWLSKGERYEDVHIRYLSEHGRINETPIPFYSDPYPAEFKIVGDRIERNLERSSDS
ncbi:Uncharacterised protein [Clostridium putrefaciens]|uniref:Uncharacterized protein n=1 Tax=Clostridium putrefaciens TaxID=99675 RepID=A0A381JCF5_9CLOT|nr:hypothetical protein [Clostridium putrefaciens]SUY48106.1 Uncharacterised protein [Clostridium putrefaciens]